MLRSWAASYYKAGARVEPVTKQQLADLRAARKVLAIDVASTAGGRGWIHPRFQFDGNGEPYPEIALVLEAFGDADSIAICDWLAEPNPVLDGRPPMHLWLTDRARVVQTAQQMAVRHARELDDAKSEG
jgi:hypothetical protein